MATSTSSLAPVATRWVSDFYLRYFGCGPRSSFAALTPNLRTPQICQFCFHHIKENLNGGCPACRAPYRTDTVEFEEIDPEE